MKILILSNFVFLLAVTSIADKKLSVKDQNAVRKVITAIASGDKAQIGKVINYSLARPYPLPAIKNEKDLIARFDELFDEKLLKEIKKSKVSVDWDRVGWRGIMFANGKVWIDETGKIIAVNYESEKQKNLRLKLIEGDRETLHESLRNYEKPILKKSNKDYKFRVDSLNNKDQNFRLTLWGIESKEGEKPLLVLDKGKLKFDGSGGNHHYTFKDKDIIYTVDVAVIAAKDTGGTSLIIEKRTVSDN